MAFTNTDLQKLHAEGKYRSSLSYGANTGLRAKKLANRVSFEVTKRVTGGANTTSTIGYFPDISVKEALQKAHAIRVDADAGLNPRLEKQKRKTKVTKGLKTLEDCIQEHILDKESARTSPIPPNTIRQTWSAFRLCSPRLLQKPIAEITPNELRECFNFMSSSQYKNRDGSFGARRQAEIWMAYTKAIFKMAHEIKDYIEVNPCPKAFYKITRDIKSYDHFLQPSEVSKMLELINDMESYPKSFIKLDTINHRLTQYQAIKLTVLTGLRNASELYTIKWDDVKLDVNKPTFYYTTSKQQQPLEVPITPLMTEVFRAQLKRRCNSYVFPSTVNSKEPDTFIKGVFKAMKRLRQLLNSSYGITQFQNSEVFNNLMLRHTFTTLGNRIGIPIEKLDAMSGHITTTQRKVATTQYISRIAEDMREDFMKLHEFMLAGKDFEDKEMSEESIKLKHKSLVARLNSPRARQSLLNYFRDKFPASYIGQAIRIVKVSKHYYTRFYEVTYARDKDKAIEKAQKEFEPIMETTGYLVELPKWLNNNMPKYMRRDLVTVFVLRELPENRSDAMNLHDISEQEMREQDTFDETTGAFRVAFLFDEIREELGDTYRNEHYFKKMPEDILEYRKRRYMNMQTRLAKTVEEQSEEKKATLPFYFFFSPQKRWDAYYNRGKNDLPEVWIDSDDEDRGANHIRSKRFIEIARRDGSEEAFKALEVLVPIYNAQHKDAQIRLEDLKRKRKRKRKPSNDSTSKLESVTI
ncbi:MAG: tyrosine-type recombinase/integrase [Dehalococcoidia bacterium]|tara:strand:- start:1669 stop:3921 length:2253 start_codon:yes stop_codon:yes gene_type:complete